MHVAVISRNVNSEKIINIQYNAYFCNVKAVL